MKILITGAAGNLGGLLAKHLCDNKQFELQLMIHKKDIIDELKDKPNIKIFRADLAREETLIPCINDVDVVVHFAGVLFKHNPEKFLPVTNTQYFKNLLDVAIGCNVKRVILISFPHVEGETTIDNPATGKLDGSPISVQAKTRLEEEKYLFDQQKKLDFEAVSLRVGMVYGKGILMIDTAKWFAKYGILGIWKTPTWIHLISSNDFLSATSNAITKEEIRGIYHLGDEGHQTLQEFLDIICLHWGYRKPVRMPQWLIYVAANVFEFTSFMLKIRAPLTKDFVKIGMVSYYGDTTSMRKELLSELEYNTFREGLKAF
jgi:nucleoside-diphosphate-sugar epimerase